MFIFLQIESLIKDVVAVMILIVKSVEHCVEPIYVTVTYAALR